MTPRRVMLGAALAAGFAALTAAPRGQAVAAKPPTAAAVPMWVDAAKTEERFVLKSTVLPDLPRTYAVNLQAGGEGREDIVTLGKPNGENGFVRLAIRSSTVTGPDASLFLTLVRHAAGADLAVTRAGQPFMLPTRLGPFEAADATLSANKHDLACLGFRMHSTDTRLRIVGLACAASAKPVDQQALACILDGIELAPEDDDAVLRGVFSDAERRRGSACRGGPDKPSGVRISESAGSPPAPAPHSGRRTGRRHSASL